MEKTILYKKIDNDPTIKGERVTITRRGGYKKGLGCERLTVGAFPPLGYYKIKE